MEERRVCLLCADRPVFATKVEAYMHARSAHPLLLEDHHPDEFFDLRSDLPERHEGSYGPWQCCHCNNRVLQRVTAEAHARGTHKELLVGREPQEGVDYVSEVEASALERLAELESAAELEVFALRVSSLRGVADFLMECRA